MEEKDDPIEVERVRFSGVSPPQRPALPSHFPGPASEKGVSAHPRHRGIQEGTRSGRGFGRTCLGSPCGQRRGWLRPAAGSRSRSCAAGSGSGGGRGRRACGCGGLQQSVLGPGSLARRLKTRSPAPPRALSPRLRRFARGQDVVRAQVALAEPPGVGKRVVDHARAVDLAETVLGRVRVVRKGSAAGGERAGQSRAGAGHAASPPCTEAATARPGR